MIWTSGRCIPEEALAIDHRDRTFEHGLGLFETLRTHRGRAPLLIRHLARLRRSSETLGLPLKTIDLPDDSAVPDLLRANGVAHEVLVRITLTGGTSEASGATLWIRLAALPPAHRDSGLVVSLADWQVARSDPLA